jgi:hypothetical protein
MRKYYIQSRKSGILHTIKRRKVNLIGHILRKNSLLKHVAEGKTGGEM